MVAKIGPHQPERLCLLSSTERFSEAVLPMAMATLSLLSRSLPTAENSTLCMATWVRMACQPLELDVKAGESLLGNVGTEAFVNSFPGADIKGTHLHWEIISDKAGLNQNGSLGIVSSDTTHRGNPDTFDINNPFFPYESEVPLPRQRPDLGDRQRSDQKTQPPDSSTNFNDRFSGINAASRAGSSGFGGPTIPFLPRASGSLVGPDGSSSLFAAAPLSPAEPVPFGGGFVPGPLSSRPLYRTGSWHVSFGPAPADAVAPNASSFGDAAQPVPPSQPEGAPLRDARQERYLGRFTYDPAQGSPFAKPPVAAQPSPDGSLSLNDAYLEYLKRLNAD